ncbi:MAG TPA: tetratricopeptide repeat protein [Chloroflexia bacterium]|nr:tetratricopeptide repeat protein [Chloroflexia bacterium]
MDRNDTANEQVSAARDDAASLVEQGMAHFEGGHYLEALALFQQAVTVAPGYAPAYNGIGRVYYHIGSPEASITAYEQAIACDPQEEAPYVGLAILLFARLGHYEDALAALARGQARHPAAGVFPDLCSTVYLRMERYEEALSSAKLAAELEPTQSSPHVRLAQVYLHLRDYDSASASCSQAESLDPSDAGTYRLRGYIEQRRGRMDAALADLRQSVSLAPSDYEAIGALARLLARLGQTGEATELLRRGRELASQDNEYGQACFEGVCGHSTAALVLLADALDRGQAQAGWARHDPEFEFLRDDPGFEALLSSR